VMEAVEARNPCLVIVDLNLPDTNGLELLKAIKEKAPDVPVVVISGMANTEAKNEARRLGACDFMSKPLNWNYLRNIAHLSAFLKESAKA
jgi:DNA-binding NtrC family response regulator